jgi:hypothetical protein
MLNTAEDKMRDTVIWLDDERNPVDAVWSSYISKKVDAANVLWVKNRKEFQKEFENLFIQGKILAVFFDNDLGSLEKGEEGKDCFSWMEEYVVTGDIPHTFYCFIQSSNSSAKLSMSLGIQSLYKYWERKS